MKQSSRIAVVLGLLLAAGTVAWYLRSDPDRAAARGAVASGPAAASSPAAVAGKGGAARRGDRAPVPVRLARIEPRTVAVSLRLLGRAEAWSTVTMRSRIDGQILSVDFQPGETVRKGQVMVVLDDRVPRAQEVQARANLARDQANLGKAVADLKRSQDLRAKGFVSSAQVDAAQAAMASLRATVDADQAAIELARTQLDYTRITAPIAGVAGSILAFPGSIVKANDTALVVINQVDPINVRFSIPEARLAEVRGRSGGALNLAVRARIPDTSLEPMTGALSFIDNAVDPTTGTIALKAEFANPTRQLTPGQFVEVDLLLRELKDALVIPAEALQQGPSGSFVYVARSDGTVELRPVRVGGGAEGATLVIDEGLAAGEAIVVDGQLRLTPGARFADASAGGPGRGGPVAPRGNGSLNGSLGGEAQGEANGVINGDGRAPADPS